MAYSARPEHQRRNYRDPIGGIHHLQAQVLLEPEFVDDDLFLPISTIHDVASPWRWCEVSTLLAHFACIIGEGGGVSGQAEKSQRSLKPIRYRDRLSLSKSGSLYIVSVCFGKFLSLLFSYHHHLPPIVVYV